MIKIQGFTLIELLIVLAILAIISGIAYPSYQTLIIETRRADAQNVLIKAQIEQSSYRIMHASYINNISVAGLPSDHQYYSFSIESASASTYLMKATVKTNSSQNADENACKTLFIDQNSVKTSDGITDNAHCWRQ
ncbi:prepilin-type N-terminal cleavage/methylation domain-containing protein [Psychromonas sp. RZ22]|uniref:type IV pilin protein n=1 Tax=Psychromonas algarum TaxID=2555643 RepID=UPI001067EAD7|nr:type IV pilin protein [Psychromonas sp. RZ22]TEW56754.1 prepilin-type N-terminal cleavage/methylation domain-containing protein [Psychromonas sp. RZ22]